MFSFNIVFIFISILGSTLGKFTEVVISECSTSDEKCNFVRGTNATMSINFKPSEYENYIQITRPIYLSLSLSLCDDLILI